MGTLSYLLSPFNMSISRGELPFKRSQNDSVSIPLYAIIFDPSRVLGEIRRSSNVLLIEYIELL